MFTSRVVFVFLALAATVLAESNTVTTVSGVFSNKPEGSMIGFDGTNNTLTVNSGGTLNTTNWSAIGVMTDACHNAATITGAGSTWSVGMGFYVGGYGSFNSLTLSAGGRMIVSNIAFMAMDPASSNNAVLITGSGSKFSLPVNDEFAIGYAGSGNGVVVSNGGELAARQVTIGREETARQNSLLVYSGVVTARYVYVGDNGGWSNRILLTGASSVLYATNTFACGVLGRASRVEILDGARLLDGWGRIGWETGADSNTVIVSGAGSTWSNSHDLYVGLCGSYNTLIVSNGGTVWSGGWTPIGQETGSVGNLAVVTGTGSSWVITNIFSVGERGLSNRLEIRNGGYVSNAWFAYIGASAGESSNAHGNSVLVTGTNSKWACQSSLWMGYDSGWNRLELRDGAFFSASNVNVGWGSLVWTGNVIDVSGPGTVWTNTGMVYIGGYGNACAVSNGPTVYSGELRASGEDSNAPVRIVLDGTNTQWFCAGRVVAGLSSSYGLITITNGAFLSSGAGMIGQEGYDEGNAIIVTGPGSVWTNSGVLEVGNSGDHNLLLVERGGKVFSGNASVGEYTGGDHNLARVSGTNSAWLSTGSLLVGDSHFNSLQVEAGGTFACTSAVVGWGISNDVVVTGAGSSWSSSGGLVIGAGSYGEWNTFMVSSGALACSRDAVLAQGKGSSNVVVVTGPGSVWSNALHFWIGQTGKCNRVTVENGARLYSGSAVIGVATASIGNVATISGPGSSWSNAGSLVVGQASSSNALIVSDGARVDVGSVTVGALGTARGCSLILDNSTLAVATTARVDNGSISANGLLYAGAIVVNTNGSLAGAAYLSLTGTGLDNSGTITVGNPVGGLIASGHFVQRPGGSLYFDLAGHEAGISYDQLPADDFAAAGTLNVARVSGFLPRTGDEFYLMPCVFNTGARFNASNLPPWFNWQVNYASSGLVLRVTGVDTATNGVPKAWLADHGWTNNFDAAATNDADGDRVATWEEYFAGTDPTNDSSFFQCLEISKTNFPTLGKIIRWSAVSGRVYAVDGSTNLLAGWQEMTNDLAVPVNAWTDTVGAEQRRYRVRVRP